MAGKPKKGQVPPQLKPFVKKAAPKKMAAPTSAQKRAVASGGIGAKAAGKRLPTKAYGDLSNHVPGHTFGNATVSHERKMATPKRIDPDGDGDNDATPSGDTDHDYFDAQGKQIKSLPGKPLPKKASAPLKTSAPVATNELASPKGMIKPSRKGEFTAKAKSAGMSVQAYAAHVLAAKKGTFDAQTVRQANFARNFGGGSSK